MVLDIALGIVVGLVLLFIAFTLLAFLVVAIDVIFK